MNNAGVAEFGGLLDASVEDYRKTMAINVDGVVYGCRTAMPYLLKSGGSIINLSSVLGLGGDWGLVAARHVRRGCCMAFLASNDASFVKESICRSMAA